MRWAIARVGRPWFAGAAQDAQHVVLLQGDAGRLDDLLDAPAHQVGGAQEAEDGFLAGRAERYGLENFVLQQRLTPGTAYARDD